MARATVRPATAASGDAAVPVGVLRPRRVRRAAVSATRAGPPTTARCGCAGGCNGHGICVDGTCHCEDGYSGATRRVRARCQRGGVLGPRRVPQRRATARLGVGQRVRVEGLPADCSSRALPRRHVQLRRGVQREGLRATRRARRLRLCDPLRAGVPRQVHPVARGARRRRGAQLLQRLHRRVPQGMRRCGGARVMGARAGTSRGLMSFATGRGWGRAAASADMRGSKFPSKGTE